MNTLPLPISFIKVMIKSAFFEKWPLNLGKILDRKRHIQDGSSKF